MRILSKPVVWHVGQLHPGAQRPLRAKRRRFSLEGRGLSVSEHPTAWRQIARLGGLPLWELARCDGYLGEFVDMIASADALTTLAAKAGLIVPYTAWRTTMTDEDGKEWYMLHASENEAAREVADEEDGGVVPVSTWATTAKLQRRWGQDFTVKLASFGDTTAQIAMLYVLEDGFDVDGAWWREDLDPVRLSAPRGVIFKSRLAAWCAEEVSWAWAPDGDDSTVGDED